jgi:hypothetical protein
MSNLVPITLETSVKQVIATEWVTGPPDYVWLGQPYKWQVLVHVRVQNHSDPDTRIPFAFTGADVQVGDWLIFNNHSLALKIHQVINQSDSTVSMIVEDVDLFNLINDSTQSAFNIGPVSINGIFDCLIVRENPDGIPQFANQSVYVLPQDLIVDIQSRFTAKVARGPTGSIQFNQGGSQLAGSSDLTWDGVTLSSTALRGQNILIANDIIRQTLANKNLTLAPGAGTGKVVVQGDLEITGNVTGAYPQVSGVLYVTQDGHDDNSGLTLDRAKKTIAAAAAVAANQILYRGWTYAVIKVSAGTYLEPNPIILQSGISVVGDNLRSVTVIPRNPYQDIFWVNPKTYISGITFRGHLHPAAVLQFPPDGVSVINKLHEWASPYIQNCSSITRGILAPDNITLLAQAGSGMIVDGDRGRKLSKGSNTNLEIILPDQVVGPDSFVVYQQNAPTLGSQVFGATGAQPGWDVSSGILESPCPVIDVSTGDINGEPIWIIQLADSVLNQTQVSQWDHILSPQSVVVLDSTLADLSTLIQSGHTLQEPGLQHAHTLLQANRAFLQAEITSYVEINYPGLLNMQQLQLCQRDVLLILDCISKDILRGDLTHSIRAGNSYWQGNSSLINGQTQATVGAIDYLAQLCVQIVQNKQIPVPLQQVIAQTTYAWLSDGGIASSQILTCASVIAHIIQLGTQINVFDNSARLLASNQAFITQECVLLWQQQFPNSNMSALQVESYVTDLIHHVQSDVKNQNHAASVSHAHQYFQEQVSLVTGFEPELLTIIQHAHILCDHVILNIQVPYVKGNQLMQYLDPALTGGGACINWMHDAFGVIVSAIQRGIQLKPTRSEQLLAFENAWALIQLNKSFIQAEVISFVNQTYPDFVYDDAKCERDLGFIADAISWDIYTGSTTQCVAAGRAYWQGTYLSIQGELVPTLAAISHAGTLMTSIISKVVVDPPLQQVVTQVIPPGFEDGELATHRCSTCVQILKNIIQLGPQSTNHVQALQNAAQLIKLNTQFLIDKIQAYMSELPTFTYDVDRLSRDISFVLACVSTDIRAGSRTESVTAGESFWLNGDSLVPDAQTQMADALQLLKIMLQNVVQNQPVALQPQVQTTQVIDTALTGGGMAVNMIHNLMDLISNMVLLGVNQALISVSAQDAVQLIQINKQFIKAEIIAELNADPDTQNYDANKLGSDLDDILQAVCDDLAQGGYKTSVRVGRSFWDHSQSLLADLTTFYSSVVLRALDLCLDVTQNTLIVASQSQIPQQINLSLDGSASQQELTTQLILIADLIQNGSYSSITTAQGMIHAHELLRLNKSWLAAKVSEFVQNTQVHVGLDHMFWTQNTALWITALSEDILMGGDKQSVQQGNSYWQSGQSVFNLDQLPVIWAAITYLRQISLDVITNTLVQDAHDVSVNQITDTQLSDGAIASDAVSDCLHILNNLIQNGTDLVPIYLMGSNTVSAVIPTLWNGEPAHELHFTKTILNYRWAPFDFQSWGNNWILSSPSSVRPYEGQGLSSMVLDAFTQYNELSLDGLNAGGMGVVIRNGGYAQLVSMFAICCNIAVLVESGGTCSITNSNTDFGNYGLWAEGVSDLQYSCVVQGGGQGPSSMLISGLPVKEDDATSFKRPYVGQLITVGKFLSDLGYTNQQFYFLESIQVLDGGSGYNPAQPPLVTIQSPSVDSGGIQAQALAVLTYDEISLTWRVGRIDLVSTGNQFTQAQLEDPLFVSVAPPPDPEGQTATAQAVGAPVFYTITTASEPNSLGQCVIEIDERLPFTPDNQSVVNFFQASKIIASSHCFEYVGSGTNIATAIPSRGGVPKQENEVVSRMGGRVAYTSTDHLGNFRIADLVINQNNGIITGRTFQKSLLAILTPYIIAIEG